MIDKFLGPHFFLSNYYSKTPVKYGSLEYTSAEHAYQAAKTKNLLDMARIHKLKTPDEARRLGQRVAIREDWDEVKDRVMFAILFEKFKAGSDLHKRLMDTGDEELIEGHSSSIYKDEYWGVCDGVGKNKLGKILMFIRSLSE